jgi:hypothetical protein
MSPWEVLEVAPDADRREIKKAYSKLIKEHRPDDSPEKFQQIRHAYESMLDSLAGAAPQPSHFPAVDLTVDATPAPTPVLSANNAATHAPAPTPAKSTSDNSPRLEHQSPENPESKESDSSQTQTANIDEQAEKNREIARQADAFVQSFETLIAKFPDNGKLSNRDLELCRLETTGLMQNEILNHWHAREYLSDSVFQLLCENIEISSGLFSTTTNFPAAFMQYLNEWFQWTENEVQLCEQCENDSAALVFHVIHVGSNSSQPNWSELPAPALENASSENSTHETTDTPSLKSKMASLFTRSR